MDIKNVSASVPSRSGSSPKTSPPASPRTRSLSAAHEQPTRLAPAHNTPSSASPSVLNLPPRSTQSATRSNSPEHAADTYQWLEYDDERTRAWVRQQSEKALHELQAVPGFEDTVAEITKIFTSKERIPGIALRGEYFCNFWNDGKNPRGFVQRVPMDPTDPFKEYRKKQPQWEKVLEIDALNQQEDKSWVWGGATWLQPDCSRCMVELSPGGGDAGVLREFDAIQKKFLTGKNSFNLPEAKSTFAWVDKNTALVASDFGPGSLTKSGYPRTIKRWERGQALADAQTIFAAKHEDMSAFMWLSRFPGFERLVVGRNIDFYNSEQFLLEFLQNRSERLSVASRRNGKTGVYLLVNEDFEYRIGVNHSRAVGSARTLLKPDGKPQKIEVPSDSAWSFWRDQLFLELRSDMSEGTQKYPAGALIVTSANAFLEGQGRHRWQVLFEPNDTRSLVNYTFINDNKMLLNIIENVASRLQECIRSSQQEHWSLRDVATPLHGNINVQSLYNPLQKMESHTLRDCYFMTYSNFLTPLNMSLARGGTDDREVLKTMPSWFDTRNMSVDQFFVKSKDGVKIPYFVAQGTKDPLNGTKPTLLYGYGGFESARLPGYLSVMGKEWLEKGGAYVLANIRGGGEYGPRWHQAAIKENKQKSYDDFIAIAEDLIRRQITSSQHLGIHGGSNGGLMVGAVMVQRPDLFKAVICDQPLLDMQRYNKLLAGDSWVGEYGNPDKPEEWAYISKYSPYHNVPESDIKMPRVLLKSANDDRVHPAHARKMAALMMEKGHDVLYFENEEGGHGGAADHVQAAKVQALEFAFLRKELGM